MLVLFLLAACTGADDPPTVEPPTQTTPPDLSDPIRFDGPPPKNVLMISIDTFRKDHLDPYGDLALTPFMGSLADEGVRLDRHVQCSNWTWHSTSCTLAGRYEVDVGHVPALVGGRYELPDGIRTLARILGENGYGSVLQSKNSWLGPKWNNAQGYDIVNPQTEPGAYGLMVSAMANREAAMNATGSDRWLVHAHLLEPHAPYIPPEVYRVGVDELPPLPEGIDLDNQDAHYNAIAEVPSLSDADAEIVLDHMRLRYQGEIRSVDAQMEAAFAEFDAAGLLDDTLVVIWTDHGEAFFEHGAQTHAHHLFKEENDGILLFWAKNLQPFVYSGPTHSVDLVPTVLSILDVPLDDDLSGHALGTAPAGRVTFSSTVARQGMQVAAMTDDGHKLLYSNLLEEYRLYDMVNDPEEKLDLLGAQPDHPLLDELQPQIEARVETMVDFFTGANGG